MSLQIPDWVKYELIERWHRVRDVINRSPRLIYGITLVCVFVLILTFIGLLSGPKRPEIVHYKKAWFYDLNTNKLFADKENHKAVRAHVFTYVNEPNEADLYIGYLTKPDPNTSASTSTVEMLVCTVEDANWVSVDSPKGKMIVKTALARDEKGRIPRYQPPK